MTFSLVPFMFLFGLWGEPDIPCPPQEPDEPLPADTTGTASGYEPTIIIGG